MPLFPAGDNNPIDIYNIKSPLTGSELLEIQNEGTGKLYAQVSDLTSGGATATSTLLVETTAALAAMGVPTGTNVIYTSGYSAIGDGGGAQWKRVTSMPSHLGRVMSTDGKWWELDSAVANIRVFGATPTGLVNCTAAINAAMSYAMAFTPSRPLYIPTGKYLVNTTPTRIPTEFTVYGDGCRNSVLIPGMRDGTAALRLVSSNEGVTLKDFGVSTYSDFTAFKAGTPAPNCIGISANDISVGHTTRYSFNNLWIDGCDIGMTIDGWIGPIMNLFITSCNLGFRGKELNGTTLNLICENNRRSWDIDDSFALTMLTLQDEGAISGQLPSRLNTCHGVTFINPYFESDSKTGLYPRTTPYMVIGDFYICQNVSMTGGMLEVLNLPRDVPPIDIIWLDGGHFECYLSVGSVGVGEGLGPRIMNTSYNVTVDASNGIGKKPYQDFSMCSSPNYNYFPNPFFDRSVGFDAITTNNAVLAEDLWTKRRGHHALKITASVGTSDNYAEFVLPTLKLPYTSMFGQTFRVGAWVFIPDITEYNDGTLDKIPDISIGWTDNVAVFRESTSVAFGTIATGTWSYITGLVTPSDTVVDIRVRFYANRTANNATGNEILYVDSCTIMHASVSVERQMREAHIDNIYLPAYEAGQLRMLGNATPTDPNQTYQRGDQVLIQEPDPYMSPGWICVGAGVGGVAVWQKLPPPVGWGLVSAMPMLAGTYQGARYYATNGRNAAEGVGAGTGCWATLTSAGGWYADWSGAVITD